MPKRLSDFIPVTTLDGTEIIPAVKAGSNVAISADQLSTSTIQRIAVGRAGALGGAAASNVTDGTVASATYRNWYTTPPYQISDLVVSFANWRMAPTGIIGGANLITVKAYVETAGGLSFPLFFNGLSTVTIEPFGTVRSDVNGVSIPPSTNFWIRVYVTNAGVSNGSWPLGRTLAANGLESSTYNTTAADLTASTGQIPNSTSTGLAAFSFNPVSISATAPSRKQAFVIYGDSIATGVGDNGSSSLGYYGGIERALAADYAWQTITRAGFRGQQMLANPAQGMALARTGNIVLDEMGVNDIYAGIATLAQMQANKLVEWSAFSARGAKVWQTTITPYTTSTDGFTTLANQTIYTPSQNTVRTSFNDWLRGGAPIISGAAVAVGTTGALVIGQSGHPLTGYIEVADLLESSRNSGLFRLSANARSVTDASINSGTNSLTSATANFTSADVGTVIYLTNGSQSLSATITTVNNSTNVSLYSQASITYSAATLKIGGYTSDGLHWGPVGHTAVKTLIGSMITSNQIRI